MKDMKIENLFRILILPTSIHQENSSILPIQKDKTYQIIDKYPFYVNF